MNMWRWLIGCMVGLVFLSLVQLMVGFASDSELFPIHEVHVVGDLNQQQKEELRQVLEGMVVEHSWLTMFSHHVLKKLDKQRWVDSVQVEKKWPDRLTVIVEPKRPYVLWKPFPSRNEESELLTQKGFSLPQQMYQDSDDVPILQCDNRQLSDAFMLLDVFFDVFSGNLLNLHALILDRRENLTIRLNNGEIWRFGNRFRKEALKRRVENYLVFKERQNKLVDSVDFRYVNGFAIRFHES